MLTVMIISCPITSARSSLVHDDELGHDEGLEKD